MTTTVFSIKSNDQKQIRSRRKEGGRRTTITRGIRTLSGRITKNLNKKKKKINMKEYKNTLTGRKEN